MAIKLDPAVYEVLPSGVMRLKARVESTTRYQDGFIIEVRGTAADEFSSPPTFKILDSKEFARKGDIIDRLVYVRGYKRVKQYADKVTGEQKKAENFECYCNLAD